MTHSGTNQPPTNTGAVNVESSETDGELPRFAIPPEPPPPGAFPSVSPSLAPVAADVEDDDRAEMATVSPVVRRARAVALFLTIVIPIVLLAVFELVTFGSEALGHVSSAAASRAQSWGAALSMGGDETRAISAEREELLTDDEARDVAASALAQSVELARVACADRGMLPTTLWVIATVGEDGKVASIAVEGPTHGRPHVASCVGGIARNLHVPRFRGPPVTAAREVTIR